MAFDFFFMPDEMLTISLSPGSGTIFTYLGTKLQPETPMMYFAVDINETACSVSQETAKMNHLSYFDVVNADMTGPLFKRLKVSK